jgi:hypothetical protein
MMITDDHWYSRGLLPKSGITVKISLGVIYFIVFLVLTDHIFNLSIYRSISDEWNPMVIITAICFIMSGMASSLIYTRTPSAIKKIFSVILASLVIAVALISLVVYIFTLERGTEPSISELPVLKLFLVHGYRMALLTAILFLLSGIILLFLHFEQKWTDYLAHIIVFPVAMISYFVLVTYIFDAEYLHEKAGTAVAPHTGLAFCALSVILMLLRPPHWLMKLLSNKTMGGIIVRRLLPVLLILPLIIGILRSGTEQYGLINSGAGAAFITLTYTVCFLIVLWFSARTVNRIDEIRFKERTSDLEQKVNDRTQQVRESENRYKTIAVEQKAAMEKLSKLNRALHSLGKSSQAMMHSRDEQQYLTEVCRIIVEDCGHKMVWIGYGQDDNEKSIIPVAFTGFEEGYLDTLKLTWSDSERGHGDLQAQRSEPGNLLSVKTCKLILRSIPGAKKL